MYVSPKHPDISTGPWLEEVEQKEACVEGPIRQPTPVSAILGWRIFSPGLQLYPAGVSPALEEIKHPCDVPQAGVWEHTRAGAW